MNLASFTLLPLNFAQDSIQNQKNELISFSHNVRNSKIALRNWLAVRQKKGWHKKLLLCPTELFFRNSEPSKVSDIPPTSILCLMGGADLDHSQLINSKIKPIALTSLLKIQGGSSNCLCCDFLTLIRRFLVHFLKNLKN